MVLLVQVQKKLVLLMISHQKLILDIAATSAGGSISMSGTLEIDEDR